MANLLVALSSPAPGLPSAQRAVLRRLAGPALLVAVGYIDPGNWATDIAGGSEFGYRLLAVVLASAVLAMGFQILVARLALATGQDLAALTARHLPAPVAHAAWLAGEAAILATALAELVGGAIALRLLFGMPLIGGVLTTAAGTLAVMRLARRGASRLEQAVTLMLAAVALSFVYLLSVAGPDWGDAARGLAQTGSALADRQGFMIALGILGATLMPHNLYLHSGMLAERGRALPDAARDSALRLARNETVLALTLALGVNAAIMVVAAASLSGGPVQVASLDQAHAAIGANLGAAAALVFALALYAAGQSSAVTGVLAGRILTRGFGRAEGSEARRVLLTRLAAGAVAVGMLAGTGGTNPDALLVLSQIVLSLALPFALVPMVVLALRRDVMGARALRGGPAAVAVAATALVVLLDGYLLADAVF